mmetsp:Transcript_38576/g.100218  ORF Transcript_38576/g.100218 Transcript_38576/m.100218 type:complete len:278 (+) Transcript_38576:1234-2067(+)
MTVLGGVRSTLHTNSSCPLSLPASSTAMIYSRCCPSRTPGTVNRMRCGSRSSATAPSVWPTPPPPRCVGSALIQSCWGNRRYSSWKGNLQRASEASTSKRAAVLCVSRSGMCDMCSVGACVSTVQCSAAGFLSFLPLPSMARTRNVWLPSASGCLKRSGLLAWIQRLSSSLISKEQPPRSAPNFMMGFCSGETLAGPDRMVVLGASGRLDRVCVAARSSLSASMMLALSSESSLPLPRECLRSRLGVGSADSSAVPHPAPSALSSSGMSRDGGSIIL